MRKREGRSERYYSPNAPVELAPSAHKNVCMPHTELHLQPEKDSRVYSDALIHCEKRGRKKREIEKMK